MKTVTFAVAIGLLMMLMSCTITTELAIHNDGSGSSTVEIKLHRLSVRYMSDLIEGFGGSQIEENVLFDVEAIQAAFDDRHGVELVSLESEGMDTLRLEIEFDDVRAILDSDQSAIHPADEPVSFTRNGTRRELEVHFSRENFDSVTGLFVLPDSPITVLIPYSEDDFLSRDEYLEVTEYAFEDYLENETMEEILSTSGISVSVALSETPSGTPSGTITRVRGGVEDPSSSSRAVFFIPLLDLLTLEEDLRLSVSWR